MAIKVGDLVKINVKQRVKLSKVLPTDSMNRVTMDQKYIITQIGIDFVSLKSNGDRGIGSDGLNFDIEPDRFLAEGWLIENFLEEAFDLGSTNVSCSEEISDIFCHCDSSNIIHNIAGGKKFIYCRNCKKERKI